MLDVCIVFKDVTNEITMIRTFHIITSEAASQTGEV